jgi:TolB-like protein/Flp pilus assembly protein TadD
LTSAKLRALNGLTCMGIVPSHRRVRFGSFEIDEIAGELRRDGVKIRLQEQPFQILQILLEHPGDLITREDLRKRVWPSDTFVDFDHGINNAIKRLREALGDTAETPRYVETLPRRGYRFIGRTECELPKIRSLAVLPLEDLSRDPEREYFADGLTEALITILAKIGDLRVISRTSAMQYKGVHKPLREIAMELDVDTVVEGTVLRVGPRVRITAQLIDAVKESHLWAESYEKDLRDVLSLQSEIAQSIAREIQVKLTPQEKAQLAEAPAVDPDAYEAYLKGRFYWNKRSGEGLRKGAECFRQAIEKDPHYAAAYAGLADCASSAGWFGFLSPEEAFAKGRLIAQKALEMDRSLGEAHASLGWALTHYDYDFASAEREHERAIELSPRYATAHQWFAMTLIPQGRLDEAFSELKRAMRLDPLSPIIHTTLSWAYYCARLYDKGVEQARKTLDLDATFPATWYCLGVSSMLNGDTDSGLTAVQKAVEFSSRGSAYVTGLAWALAKAGQTRDARTILDEALRERAAGKYFMAAQVATIYVELQEKDEALRWLEEGYQERSAWMVYLKTDPRYDPLRSEPRFCDLVRRMNFPD